LRQKVWSFDEEGGEWQVLGMPARVLQQGNSDSLVWERDSVLKKKKKKKKNDSARRCMMERRWDG
jgi:hypothetical protein